ncbi:GDSL-type esterase/lipase family protein [Streptomyces sp. NPDC086554]|uniref:GDSL-type esterase/lipase family protein n=1 Tax=Streptomyces sp. NPDC086554 TaxID=3154864 RepID=UPI00342C9B27
MKEFTRGAAWSSPDGRMLRADPADQDRLPGDTWERASLPAGVRLEFTACGVRAVEVTYAASPPSGTDSYCHAPPVFTLLADSVEGGDARARGGSGTVAVGTSSPQDAPARAVGTPTPPGARTQAAFDVPAAPGSHVARIELPYPDGDFTLHLPETLRPVGGGTLTPPTIRPRWLVYGDSIAEGWGASRPHLAWPALAGRALGVDTVNLGYARAARGELASAQQLASLEADLITVAFGTNCWSRTPHSAGLLHETTRAFLTLVRRRHPEVPLLVLSPALRPDAESTPNALGATLSELRTALERAAGDAGVALLPCGGLLEPRHLVDGVHPGDAGHRVLADAVVSALLKGQSWAASS